MEIRKVALVVLFQVLYLVNAQQRGSSGWSAETTQRSGWTSESTTTRGWGRESSPASTGDEQWGGVGDGGVGGFGQSTWGRPTNNNNNNQQPGNGYDSQSQQYGSSSAFGRPEGHLERYGVPERCVFDQNYREVCDYYVEIWTEQGNNQFIDFVLSSHIKFPSEGGYVAVGLSKDREMGQDDIVECAKDRNDGESLRVSHSWASGKSQPAQLRDNSQIVEFAPPQFDAQSKILTCRFRRPLYAKFEADRKQVVIDFLREKYFVLLAVGEMRKENPGLIGYHGNKPLQTGQAYASQNPLGYSQEWISARQYGNNDHDFNGSSGQHKVATCTVTGAIIYSFLQLFN